MILKKIKIMSETERLLHRKFTIDDLDKLIEMRLSEDVMNYLGGKKMQNRESLKDRLGFYISCYPQKIGLQAIILKETGEMIGWSGLQPLENSTEIEVSYGLIKEYWGKGIATETALFWLNYGFKDLGLERIVAVADKENVGSWKIMEKIGMQFEKESEHYGMNCVLYSISKIDFINREI